MSKKTNYSKISNMNEAEIAKVVDATGETVDTVVEPISTDAPAAVVEETKPIVDTKPEIIYGKVVGCTKLNVRKEPIVTSDIVRTVNKDEKIVINLDKSNDEFYSVRLGAIKGYCMKKYIEIVK